MTTQQLKLYVKKREGYVESFQKESIINAIKRAFLSTGQSVTLQDIDNLVSEVESKIPLPEGSSIDVEHIQDLVETVLMDNDYFDVAKQYILYRNQKRILRDEKKKILNASTLGPFEKKLSKNTLNILAGRYLVKNSDGNIIETPTQLMQRVAALVALPSMVYDTNELYSKEPLEVYEDTNIHHEINQMELSELFARFTPSLNPIHIERFCEFYNHLINRRHIKKSIFKINKETLQDNFTKAYNMFIGVLTTFYFLPNTPTLMNAGVSKGLSACFVLPAPDEIDEYIRGTLGDVGAIFKEAGGVGVDMTEFRPEGSMANGIPEAASGPISYMEMINTLTNVIKSGGKRRGANMAVLHDNHPDIEKFITMKQNPEMMKNFNVSVGISDTFWNKLVKGEKEHILSHPRSHIRKTVNPQNIWELIAMSAWKSAEPGLLFFDNANATNFLFVAKGPYRSTNPCGEQFLYPFSSCNLGSINIANFVDEDGNFDYESYEYVIRVTTVFLNNVIDINHYPTPQISNVAKLERRIGLGVMGVADALFKMGVRYNSEKGFDFMSTICDNMTSYSMHESSKLAAQRGQNIYWNDMIGTITSEPNGVADVRNWVRTHRTKKPLQAITDEMADDIFENGMLNTWVTTVAPTGTIAMIADTSNGMEPMFSLAFEKKVPAGRFYYASEIFAEALKKEGLYNQEILKKVAENGGSCQSIEEIPLHIREVFVTAMDMHWIDHVMAQAACQWYIDNSISKTINMPEDVSVSDIKNSYLLAHEVGLKGTTVFRDKSREEQVLHTGNTSGMALKLQPSLAAQAWILQNIHEPYVKDSLKQYIDIENAKTVNAVGISRSKIICKVCKKGEIIYAGGCETCSECGKSSCAIA